jgi:hypothetical protein
MEWGIGFFDELQKMKKQMDQVWDDLFEEKSARKEKEVGEWIEKLPKFEGKGRRGQRSRINKTIKTYQ